MSQQQNPNIKSKPHTIPSLCFPTLRTSDKVVNRNSSDSTQNKTILINGVLKTLNSLKDDTSTCPICMDRKKNAVLGCWHAFCSSCLTDMLARDQHACPNCRHVFDKFNPLFL